MAWATSGDVLAKTGATVTEGELAMAQGVVELFAGISEDNTSELHPRNARMLLLAVAYQAAWMQAQVDVTGRMDVAAVQQDGAQVERGHRDAMVLAPLASRALDRLSWRGRRGTLVVTDHSPGRSGFGSQDELQAAFLRDETSDRWIEASA